MAVNLDLNSTRRTRATTPLNLSSKSKKSANLSISGFLKCGGRNGTSMGTGFIQ